MELSKEKKVIVERHNKVVYDNGDTVVKVFNGSKPAADILNEGLNLARAEQAGINVPTLTEISKVGNSWAIATLKVEGLTLRQLPEDARYELLMKLDGLKNHAKVCHGDFVPSNVIIPEKGEPVIVDWAHATQGNGAADCATTYLRLLLNDEKELAEKYIAKYCEKQGCTREYVNEWMGIVAAAELARGRVHETEFLLRWVNVYDGM